MILSNSLQSLFTNKAFADCHFYVDVSLTLQKPVLQPQGHHLCLQSIIRRILHG